jgi:hypothetical protein
MRDWIPALAAPAGAQPGHPLHAYEVMMLTIRPTWADAESASKAARQQLNVPLRSMSMMVRQPLADNCSVSQRKFPAALLMRMSRLPCSATTRSTTACTMS